MDEPFVGGDERQAKYARRCRKKIVGRVAAGQAQFRGFKSNFMGQRRFVEGGSGQGAADPGRYLLVEVYPPFGREK